MTTDFSCRTHRYWGQLGVSLALVIASQIVAIHQAVALDCNPFPGSEFMVGDELPVDVTVVPWRIYAPPDIVGPTLIAERSGDGELWEPLAATVESPPMGDTPWIRLPDLQEGDRVRLAVTDGDAAAEFVVGPVAPVWAPQVQITEKSGFEFFDGQSYGEVIRAAWVEVNVEPGELERYGPLPWVSLIVTDGLRLESDICGESPPGASVFGRYTQRVFVHCDAADAPTEVSGTVQVRVHFAGSSVEYLSEEHEVLLTCETNQPSDSDTGLLADVGGTDSGLEGSPDAAEPAGAERNGGCGTAPSIPADPSGLVAVAALCVVIRTKRPVP